LTKPFVFGDIFSQKPVIDKVVSGYNLSLWILSKTNIYLP